MLNVGHYYNYKQYQNILFINKQKTKYIQIVQNFQNDYQNQKFDLERVQKQLINASLIENHDDIQIDQQKDDLKKQDDNNYKKTFNCNKQELNQLSQIENIQILVQKYEKKQGGLLSQSYIVYIIQTQPLDWTVSRRYNDFCWLHQTLEKAYPGISIPPIPKKQTTRNFQPLFLNKRMAFMQQFLNKIFKSPELKNSKYIEGFLGMVSDEQFKQLQKESERLNKLQRVQNLENLNGKADCVINNDMNVFFKQNQDYLSNQETIYKKIKKLCKQLIIDFDQLSTTLFNLGDCFNQQHQITQNLKNRYSQDVFIYHILFYKLMKIKVGLLDQIYINLNNACVQWGNVLTNQIKLVQENLIKWFKFYSKESISLKGLIKQRDVAEKEFFSYKQKLNYKKDRLFTLGEIHKWEIPSNFIKLIRQRKLKNKEFAFQYMLPKDSITEIELRDIYGYYNNTVQNEIKRLLGIKVEEYSKHFTEFAKNQSYQVTQLSFVWIDLTNSMENISQGLSNQNDNQIQIEKKNQLLSQFDDIKYIDE
ncbi:PX domain protein [Ichthyophthirius multifiliis]|uniref:PX domain protein n=1 Tax=Ichthyophthirius multifiliis TaxID=5932 RepID=G0QKW0_ICHMU|nr:PX domain protein [Ichthyophthirius multifiliis]EGR34144.1 PX domain protein [Ichthyophthirius multifiliis]|eukprot:XP_004039448.1 PX domain protein [Ichthyophthirius multifiliis]